MVVLSFMLSFCFLTSSLTNTPMKDLDHQSKTIYLKEYKQPDFLIDHVELTFALADE